MIDLHCHILPGLDDGARDIGENSVQLHGFSVFVELNCEDCLAGVADKKPRLHRDKNGCRGEGGKQNVFEFQRHAAGETGGCSVIVETGIALSKSTVLLM